jgi:hypothetical protein
VNCNNGYCCPEGNRCQPVLIRDDATQTSKVVEYCCLELPEDTCCQGMSIPPLAQSHASTPVPLAKGGARKCGKTVKARPFDVLQVAAGANGAPASFDVANRDYSLAFSLRGKKGPAVVLKVPIIEEDSNANGLSVMVPPYLLRTQAQGKAEVFLLTDGVMGDTCVAKVKIARLPKSASKVPGLVTASWLRANQTLYGQAKPTLSNAAAAPFVSPEVGAEVDSAATTVGGLIPTYTGVTKGNPVLQTAKHSDSLLTGILTSAQKVNDPAFSSACRTWVQALSKAKSAEDGTLKAAEDAFVNVLLNASGPSAQSVVKFVNGCGAVTTAGMAASAVMISSGHAIPAKVDAQATSVVVCGATITACGVITGTAAVAAGVTIRPGETAYGRGLLRGATRISSSTRINHGGLNLTTAKVCKCPQPGLIDIVIVIINICDRIRINTPRYCIPDGNPQPHGSTTTSTTVTTSTIPGPTTTLPCPKDCPGKRSHKCPWTPEGYSITPCCPGFCWDGGGLGSLSCDQEVPGAPGEERYGNPTVPNSRRSYTTDLICNDGFVPVRERCTGILLQCVPAQ